MRRSMNRIVCALLLWSSTAVTEAATYYVATSGNDSNPGTQASPWRTIQKAANTAVAGDIVNVRGGIYVEANVTMPRSGTSASPITLQAYPGELPIVDGTGLGHTSGFVLAGVSNIIIDGFEVRNHGNGGVPNGGEFYVHHFQTTSLADKTIIRNCHIHGWRGVDNPSGIFVNALGGTLEIYNNVIHDNSGSAFTPNNEGVSFYADEMASSTVSQVTVRNNEIYNEGVPLKWKHHKTAGGPQPVVVFEKNLIHDGTWALTQTEQDGTIIRNNIFYNCASCDHSVSFGNVGGSGTGSNGQFYNNSLYNVITGPYLTNIVGTSTGFVSHDNILFTTGSGTSAAGAGLFTEGTLAEHNPSMNFDLFAGAAINKATSSFSSALTFTQLQATGREASGRTATLLYVNPGGAIPNFHLQLGSPGKGVGTGGLDMGAYPTGTEIIGPTTGGGGDATPPSSPANLRVS